MPRSRLLRAAARLWWLKIFSEAGGVPAPRDAPSIRSRAEDPDRVLIVGNGAARGWGVATYGLALAGHLAHAAARATGRPCDVDQIGDEAMNVASAGAWIGSRSLRGYDAVVLVLGMGDAVRQLPEPRWRADLERLLTTVLDGTRASVPVLVTGIEPVASVPVFTGLFGRLGQRHADRLNAVTRDVVAGRERVHHVDLPAGRERYRERGAPTAYAEWGAHLAASLAPELDGSRSAPDRAGVPVLEPEELAPTAALAGDPEALRALLEDARAEFSADLAWIGLQSGDRQVIAMTTLSNGPSAVPTDLTFCRYTIERNDTFVVPDAGADPRFAGNPFLEVTHLEAYAGHPLRAPDGTVIGTFCVAAIRPRSSFASTAGVLERYARDAETELGRVERDEAQRISG